MINPSFTESAGGLLTDDQLYLLGRMILGIAKVRDAIDRLNDAAAEGGLYIRQADSRSLDLMGNDISMIAARHVAAEKDISDRMDKLKAANEVQRVAA